MQILANVGKLIEFASVGRLETYLLAACATPSHPALQQKAGCPKVRDTQTSPQTLPKLSSQPRASDQHNDAQEQQHGDGDANLRKASATLWLQHLANWAGPRRSDATQVSLGKHHMPVLCGFGFRLPCRMQGPHIIIRSDS